MNSREQLETKNTGRYLRRSACSVLNRMKRVIDELQQRRLPTDCFAHFHGTAAELPCWSLLPSQCQLNSCSASAPATVVAPAGVARAAMCPEQSCINSIASVIIRCADGILQPPWVQEWETPGQIYLKQVQAHHF